MVDEKFDELEKADEMGKGTDAVRQQLVSLLSHSKSRLLPGTSSKGGKPESSAAVGITLPSCFF